MPPSGASGGEATLPLLGGSPRGKDQNYGGKALTLLPLVTLIFFEVSGGPFGTEVSEQGERSRSPCGGLSLHTPDV